MVSSPASKNTSASLCRRSPCKERERKRERERDTHTHTHTHTNEFRVSECATKLQDKGTHLIHVGIRIGPQAQALVVLFQGLLEQCQGLGHVRVLCPNAQGVPQVDINFLPMLDVRSRKNLAVALRGLLKNNGSSVSEGATKTNNNNSSSKKISHGDPDD